MIAALGQNGLKQLQATLWSSYSWNTTEDAVKRAIILSVDATTAFYSTKKKKKN